MSAVHRRWAIIIAAVLLVIALVAPIVITRLTFGREKIASELSKHFPGQVHISRFRNTYFPRPGCVLSGLTIQQRGDTPDQPFLAAEELTMSGSYPRLLSHKIRIVGKGVRVYLAPDKDAHDYYQSGDKDKTKVEEIRAADSFLLIGRKNDEPLRFEVRHVQAGPALPDEEMRFDVEVVNPLPRGLVRAAGKVGPWVKSNVGLTSISGTYEFKDADLGTFSGTAGVLSSRGKFTGKLASIGVSGAVRVPDFTVKHSGHPVNLTADFRANVDGTNGDVALESVEANWGKTTLLASGTISGRSGEHGKTLDARLSVKRGRIEDLMTVATHAAPTMEGPVVFEGRAVWPPGKARFIQRIQFTADFMIDDGRFTRQRVQQNVDKLSERARGEKDDDLRRVATTLKGHVALHGGVAHVSNASMQVPDARAEFSGTANLVNDQIRFEGRLRMAATASQAATGFKSVLLKVVDPLFKNKKRHAGSDLPVELTGTIGHPHVGLDLDRIASR